MHFDYQPKGVCSRKISFEINDNIITNVSFEGGCNGNLKAIAKLVEGQSVDYIEEKLIGNTCGMKPTSCGDQLAKAVRAAANAQ